MWRVTAAAAAAVPVMADSCWLLEADFDVHRHYVDLWYSVSLVLNERREQPGDGFHHTRQHVNDLVPLLRAS